LVRAQQTKRWTRKGPHDKAGGRNGTKGLTRSTRREGKEKKVLKKAYWGMGEKEAGRQPVKRVTTTSPEKRSGLRA